MKKVKFNDKVLVMDVSFLTVKKRREIKKALAKPAEAELPKDDVILAELAANWKVTPPDVAEIYRGFTRLRSKPIAEETKDNEPLFERLCAAICKWETPGGLVDLTYEEFENFPFDLAERIQDVFSEEDHKSFLEIPPVMTTA